MSVKNGGVLVIREALRMNEIHIPPTLERMLPPTPNSIPSHGGPRQFDKRYNAGRTEGGSWVMRTRNAFVSVEFIAMRDRVDVSV